MQELLERQPGVAQVVGSGESADAARLRSAFVVFDSDPLGARAVRNLDELHEAMPGLLLEVGLSRAGALFAGDTALAAETIDKTVADLGSIAPTAMVVVLVILAIFLRALIAPLVPRGRERRSIGRGARTHRLRVSGSGGQRRAHLLRPFAAAVLLVSLGSDYNVFLAGRIWDEARVRPLREAVAIAGARAATPITIAGVVLAGSFALMALVPLRPFRELAFAMAVGFVIDAFLVRTLLVPALIVLWASREARPRDGFARSRAARAPALRLDQAASDRIAREVDPVAQA